MLTRRLTNSAPPPHVQKRHQEVFLGHLTFMTTYLRSW